MTPEDTQRIETWSLQHDQPVTLVLASDKSPEADQLTAFCEKLKKLLPSLAVKKDNDDPFRSPAILMGTHRNIAYQAVPAGKELPPFLEALSAAAGHPPRFSADLSSQLDALDLPVLLKLYIAQQCPHCPAVAGQMLALAAANANIRLAVIDAQLFPQESEADQIRSVPTLIMDDQLRWTGQVETAEIIKLGKERDPSKMSAASLRQILETGDASRAAQMMADQDKVFPALVDLLLHPRWSVRLGAMVTVEYLAGTAPQLAAQLAETLWRRFADLDEQIQGDVANVLGLTQSQAARGYLKRIADGPYTEDVKEAARDALEDMDAV